MPIDVLIVGQGLAGSLLAWELMQHRFRVMVIDSGGENASQVAAGLINPVTGQRLVKSHDIEHCLPAAMALYRQLAETFNQRFFVPVPMLRILRSLREQKTAGRRLAEPAYQTFLQALDSDMAGINSPFGMLKQQHTGYLRTRLLLDALREFFIANSSYRQTLLDYGEIVLQPRLRWRDIEMRHVVFCEGYKACSNPWFGRLPFQPAKGQILSCRVDAGCPQQILNFGHWLIPTGQRQFKIGATFEPGKTDTQPTEHARQILLQGLAEVCPDLRPLEVVAHQAGVRPSTLDKQPFIGPHPRHPNLHIFNGFGAKGSLAIPWHARGFAAALKQQTPLPETSNIQRYEQTHFPG